MQLSDISSDVWYHGDTNQRTTFAGQKMDRDRYLEDLNAIGPGIYFTNLKSQAVGYAREDTSKGGKRGYVYTCRLNTDRILEENTRPTRGILAQFMSMIPKEDLEYGLSNFDENPHKARLKVLAAYSQEDCLHTALISMFRDLASYDPNYFCECMVKLGFDCLRHPPNPEHAPGVEHMIVWNPDIIEVLQEEPYVETP